MTGKDLRALRSAIGWTQREMGDELGIHANTVARLERGDLPITKRMAQTIKLVSDVAYMRMALDRTRRERNLDDSRAG